MSMNLSKGTEITIIAEGLDEAEALFNSKHTLIEGSAKITKTKSLTSMLVTTLIQNRSYTYVKLEEYDKAFPDAECAVRFQPRQGNKL